MERGIIDRFEGDIVVIEINGDTRDLSRALLPPGAKIGDAVLIEDGKILLDHEETVRRKQEIQTLMDELFET